jgi:predicted  nucleic acid-binding Zn-ribbon protein
MKKILIILVIAVLAISLPLLYLISSPFKAFADQYIYLSPCDIPIQYRIGSIDPRFSLSNNQFLANIKQAEAIWEDATSKNLFDHDDNAQLSINLVYDKRQSLNVQIGELEQRLGEGKSALDSKIQDYQNQTNEFNQKLKNLNDNISFWNSQGGAPPEEYDKLVAEQQNLQQEADRLNRLASTLNISTEQYNAQVGELNSTISSFRRELDLRPEEGLYDPERKEIAIFLTSSPQELIHTLSHEMGHALGMTHVTGEESIMFPFSSESMNITGEDMNELLIACEKQNRVSLAFQNASLRVSEMIAQFSPPTRTSN